MKNCVYMAAVIFCAVISLNAMQTDIVLQNAHYIEQQLFMSSGKSTDSFIATIKEHLNDQSLSSADSSMVKKALLSMLATKICWTQSASLPSENSDIVEYRVTQFWDGSQVVEESVHIYPLDLIDPMLSKKTQKQSCIGGLPFEECLRYIFSYKTMQKNTLVPKSISVSAH